MSSLVLAELWGGSFYKTDQFYVSQHSFDLMLIFSPAQSPRTWGEGSKKRQRTSAPESADTTPFDQINRKVRALADNAENTVMLELIEDFSRISEQSWLALSPSDQSQYGKLAANILARCAECSDDAPTLLNEYRSKLRWVSAVRGLVDGLQHSFHDPLLLKDCICSAKATPLSVMMTDFPPVSSTDPRQDANNAEETSDSDEPNEMKSNKKGDSGEPIVKKAKRSRKQEYPKRAVGAAQAKYLEEKARAKYLEEMARASAQKSATTPTSTQKPSSSSAAPTPPPPQDKQPAASKPAIVTQKAVTATQKSSSSSAPASKEKDDSPQPESPSPSPSKTGKASVQKSHKKSAVTQVLMQVKDLTIKKGEFIIHTTYKEGNRKKSTFLEQVDEVFDLLKGTSQYEHFLQQLIESSKEKYPWKKRPKTLQELLGHVAKAMGAKLTFRKGGPVSSFTSIEMPAPLNVANREHTVLKPFHSEVQMIHKPQQMAECLLLAFQVASRSNFPLPEHFDDYNNKFANGFTIDSLRLALVRARSNPECPFVLRKLNGGSWDLLKRLPAGVYIVECQIKLFDRLGSRFPHFVALDTHHSTICDSMRTSLLGFTDAWVHSCTHDVIAIVHIFQIMCRC